MTTFDAPIAEAQRLLNSMSDEQIVLRTGVTLEEVIGLRAALAAAPLPVSVKSRTIGEMGAS